MGGQRGKLPERKTFQCLKRLAKFKEAGGPTHLKWILQVEEENVRKSNLNGLETVREKRAVNEV